MSESPLEEAFTEALSILHEKTARYRSHRYRSQKDAVQSTVQSTVQSVWASLSVRHQVGLADGLFAGQIQSSGAQFWIHNEFAEHYQGLFQPLLRTINTPTTTKVAALLDAIWDIHNESERLETQLLRLEAQGMDPDEPDAPPEVLAVVDALDALAARCDDIDATFKACSAQYKEDLESFLTSQTQ